MQKIISILIAFFICPLLVFSQQQLTKDELQKQQKQLEQEIKELNNLRTSLNKKKGATLKEKIIIEAKVKKREQLISSINKDIRRVEDQLYTNEVEINHLKKELDTLKQHYAKSIVFAYKNRGNYEYLNFLFSAKDFNDAFKRITYLKSYRQYRETQAETIVKTQHLLTQATISLNNTRTEKTQVLKTQNEQLAALENDKKENAKVVQDLKNQEKEVQAQLHKREKQRQELNKAIAAAVRREIDEANRKERDRLAKLKADAEKAKISPTTKPVESPKTPNRTPSETTTGVAGGNKFGRDYTVFESTEEGLTRSINFENNKLRLPWPVNGGLVTHEFGQERINGVIVQNDGITIAVSVGTSVKCVADGEVMAIINLDDDEAVMVNHGKYFTVYNKLSSTSVSKGQKVSAGTIVGKAAASLDGSGGEIEFRIMSSKSDKNQQYINPRNWLKTR